MPMAITRSFTSLFIRALCHSPQISPKLEKDVFIVWKKLDIISAPLTRRSYRAGAQVRREYALKQFLPLGYVNATKFLDSNNTLSVVGEMDVLAITETWAKSAKDGDDLLRRACPPGYLFVHSARCTGRGGGGAIVYRDTFRSFDSEAVKAAGDCTSFELTGTMLCVNSVSIDLLVIYQPPLNCINRFFTEFTSFLERLASSTKKTLLMGDFNTHVDNVNENVPALFSSLLKSFGWCLHAKGPTHTEGHTLDLILSRVTDNLISSCNVGGIFSDHLAIELLVRAHRPVRSRKSIIFRSIKKIYTAALGVTCWSCR